MRERTLKMRTFIVAMALALAAGTPAVAQSCGDEITALEQRIDREGREAVSTSTSGKETSARREAQGVEAHRANTSPSNLPGGPAPGTGEAAAQNEAADAGGAGTGVMSAKASLNEARTAQNAGDDAQCRRFVDEAKRQLEGRP